jgi:hypothetical protein
VIGRLSGTELAKENNWAMVFLSICLINRTVMMPSRILNSLLWNSKDYFYLTLYFIVSFICLLSDDGAQLDFTM